MKLTKADQLALIGGEAVEATGARSLLTALLDLSLPLPTPYEPFEETAGRLVVLYQELSKNLVRFLNGLALWDEMDDTTRRRLVDQIVEHIPKSAVTRYEELFRATAADCREFDVWASLKDHAWWPG